MAMCGGGVGGVGVVRQLGDGSGVPVVEWPIHLGILSPCVHCSTVAFVIINISLQPSFLSVHYDHAVVTRVYGSTISSCCC